MAETRVCKRCGREYDDPVPPITNPGRYINTEIMSREWCAGCNTVGAMAIHRGTSAYFTLDIIDPLKGGKQNART